MRDAGRWSELRIPGIAAQTRMVSLARIRLVSHKSPRIFKRIICDDISEFESFMPSHAVGLHELTCPRPPLSYAESKLACFFRGLSFNAPVRVTCTVAWKVLSMGFRFRAATAIKCSRAITSELDSSPGGGREQCGSTQVLQKLRAGLIDS
jgi:hypothetical protein